MSYVEHGIFLVCIHIELHILSFVSLFLFSCTITFRAKLQNLRKKLLLVRMSSCLDCSGYDYTLYIMLRSDTNCSLKYLNSLLLLQYYTIVGTFCSHVTLIIKSNCACSTFPFEYVDWGNENRCRQMRRRRIC